MNCTLRVQTFFILAAASALSISPTANAGSVADYTVWRDSGSDVSQYQTWRDNYIATGAMALPNAIISPSSGPTASVTGVINGGNIDWTLFFTPAEPLSSLAVEFVLEVPAGTLDLGSIVVAPNFSEFIMGTQIINPGNNPFTGTITRGTSTHPNTFAALGSGLVDGIFAPLGSTDFGNGFSPGPQEALTFTTFGTTSSVTFGGLIAQAGASVNIPATTATAIPEPSSVVFAIAALAAALSKRRSLLA